MQTTTTTTHSLARKIDNYGGGQVEEAAVDEHIDDAIRASEYEGFDRRRGKNVVICVNCADERRFWCCRRCVI